MSDIVAVAKKEIGVKESPPDSNKVKYNTWYYGREVSGAAYPWCMVFVQWCCAQTGVAVPVKTASCSALLNAAKAKGEAVYSGYKPGDVVIYDFGNDGKIDHCGIVENAYGSTVIAIEGNTGVGNDSNGGEVMRRTRSTSTIVGAWRPKEVETVTYDEWKAFMQKYRQELQDNDSSAYSAEARQWALDNGIVSGGGKLNGLPNYMWEDFSTREQLVTLLYRFAQSIGKA